jgi:shikimate 5-dehydrogenase
MNALNLTPASRPTLHFIGVTTGSSMIMRVFPAWMEYLGLTDSEISGIDLALHDRPERYREVVEFIKRDPLSSGALVTTHKIDLVTASRDLFDQLDDFASLLGEVSCIWKDKGRLLGGAKDPITSGQALEGFLPAGHWERTNSDVFIMGAGGSSLALTTYLLRADHGRNCPRRVFVSNRSPARLDAMQRIHQQLRVEVPIEYILTPDPRDNERVMRKLRPHSLVVNATGLGKDAPGSPITDDAVFPDDGFAWDFNYRGNLVFLDQAQAQAERRRLTVVDGWLYFIYGWTGVIAEVFHRDIPSTGPEFDALCRIAEEKRKPL